MKSLSIFRYITLIIIYLLLVSCGGGSGDVRIISDGGFGDSTLYTSRATDITYEINSRMYSGDETTITFFLVNVDDDSDTYYLGTDFIENIELYTTYDKEMRVKLDSSIPAGDYSLQIYVEENADGSPSYISENIYTVDHSLDNVTNVSIDHIYLMEDTIIIDPSEDKTEADLPAEIDFANMDAIRRSMVAHADIIANADILLEGPMPAGDITLEFEISIDEGATWMPVELWNSDEQAYSDHINVDFPGYDEGADIQTVAILANISQEQYNTIFADYLANADSYSDSLDYAQHFLARKIISVDGIAQDSDDVYSFDMTVYPVLPESDDSAAEGRSYPAGVQPNAKKYVYKSKRGSLGNGYVRVEPYAYATYAFYDATSDIKLSYPFVKYPTTVDIPAGASYSMGCGVPLTAMDHEIDLLSFYANVTTAREKSTTGYYLGLNMAGFSVWSRTSYGSYTDQTFSKSPPWYDEKELFKKKYWVGSWPIKITVTATGELSVSTTLSVHSDYAGFTNSKLPETEFHMIFTGGPDWGAISFDMTADLMLIDNTFSPNGGLEVRYSGNKVANGGYTVGVTDHIESLTGKLYFKANIFGYETTKTFYNRTTPILKKDYNIFVDHINF